MCVISTGAGGLPPIVSAHTILSLRLFHSISFREGVFIYYTFTLDWLITLNLRLLMLSQCLSIHNFQKC